MGQVGAKVNRSDRDECFTEKLDGFLGGISHINERWNDRLVWQNTGAWEGYLKGHFSLVLIFSNSIDQDGYGEPRDFKIIEISRPSRRLDRQFFKFVDREGRDQEIVFVELVELGDGPKNMVPTVVGMRLQTIKKQPLYGGEGLLYRRLSDGIYQILPGFMKWESAETTFPGLVPEGGPDMVEGAPQIVDTVTDHQGNLLPHEAKLIDADDSGLISITGKDDLIVVTAPDAINGRYKLVDVAVGPYNL